ncbi:MAG: hypothetical protein Q7U53_09730 [Anaerolineaceae bacterium]|nr:hypothetical protein [Anaerolineaceae bacterium]
MECVSANRIVNSFSNYVMMKLDIGSFFFQLNFQPLADGFAKQIAPGEPHDLLLKMSVLQYFVIIIHDMNESNSVDE